MLTEHLYREKAMIRRAQSEPIDYPMRVTAPHEWLLVVMLGLAAVVVVAWSALGTIERTITERGVLVFPGNRFTVVSAVSGSVVETLVQTGDTVRSGQPIARLRLRDLDWRVRVTRARLDLLENAAALSSSTSGVGDEQALAAARAELLELEAFHATGETIVSLYPGEVSAYHMTKGQILDAGVAVAEIRSGDETLPDVVVAIDSDRAGALRTGMEARVTISAHDGAGLAAVMPARIVSIAPRRRLSAPWLVRFGLDATPGAVQYLVRLALDADPPAVPDGVACRVEMILERSSPIRLLVSPIRH